MSKGKSTVHIDIDMDVVSRWAETFTSAEFISKQKGALARAMKPIVNDARSNLSMVTSLEGHGKNNASVNFREGIRERTLTNGEVGVLVSITNKAGMGNFLLPMFEGGTAPRYIKRISDKTSHLKKKESRERFKSGDRRGYRGVMTRTNFFSHAVESHRGNINSSAMAELDKGVQQLLNKRGLK